MAGEQAPDGARRLEIRSFDRPDAVRGRTRFVSLTGARIALATFEVGWRWSVHSRPVFGGESCRTEHLGYLISGRLGILMDDGTEGEVAAGCAFRVAPGHVAWVVGDEPGTFVEFFPA
jgi:hypothetical protein